MKHLIWKGYRRPDAENDVVVMSTDGIVWANVPLYLNEVNHSPTGFAWGYGGSGPAQLAYAILRTCCEIVLKDPAEDIPRQYYQYFKDDFVSTWGLNDDWTLTSDIVVNWLKKKAAE